MGDCDRFDSVTQPSAQGWLYNAQHRKRMLEYKGRAQDTRMQRVVSQTTRTLAVTEYCPMALFARQCRCGVRLDWDLNPTHVVSRVHTWRKSMGEYLGCSLDDVRWTAPPATDRGFQEVVAWMQPQIASQNQRF